MNGDTAMNGFPAAGLLLDSRDYYFIYGFRFVNCPLLNV